MTNKVQEKPISYSIQKKTFNLITETLSAESTSRFIMTLELLVYVSIIVKCAFHWPELSCKMHKLYFRAGVKTPWKLDKTI